VVEDYLEMHAPHDIEIFLHCAPEAHALPTCRGVRVLRGGRAVDVRWPDFEDGRAEILLGRTGPIAGWVSRRFDRREPAPTLVWRARLACDTVLRTTFELPS
jgi:hypothetical protein